MCWSMIVLAPITLLAIQPARSAQAQDEQCFESENPAITNCIAGRFRAVWEASGGLVAFGYPLTPATINATPDGAFLSQTFERARFELHPENAPPYDVLLGRLGAEQLAVRGEDWQAQPRQAPREGCLYWHETGFNICGPFLGAWRSAGLRGSTDPMGAADHLALWGLPISPERTRTTANGMIVEQWFERARFELHPDGTMMIGRLGAEALATSPAAEAPSRPAPAAPEQPSMVAEQPSPDLAAIPVAPPLPSVVFPAVPCNVNVPEPAEGIQVWMATPRPRGSEDAVVCVRLIIGGEAATGAPAITYRYIGDGRRASIPQSTGRDGVASFIFYVGDLPAGLRVPVEANVLYRGVTYTAWTEFTKQ